MSSFVLRTPTSGDLVDITYCWQPSFGDEPALIRRLLTGAELLPNALAAVDDGHVCSVMFAFDGLRFGSLNTSYLYALCTRPDRRGRGMGGAVVRELTRRCFARGADMVCLSPASPSLGMWYRSLLGTSTWGCWEDVPFHAEPDACFPCAALSGQDYLMRRGSGIGLTPQLIAAQETLNADSGGAFLGIALGGAASAVLCAEPRGGRILVRELCCPERFRSRALSTAAAWFGCGDLLLRTPSRSGESLAFVTRGKNVKAPENRPLFPFILE